MTQMGFFPGLPCFLFFPDIYISLATEQIFGKLQEKMSESILLIQGNWGKEVTDSRAKVPVEQILWIFPFQILTLA